MPALFLRVTFPLPNQVHTEHYLVPVICAVYLGPWASRERVKRGRFNDIRFTWSCVAKKSVMALQKLSVAKAVGFLTPCGSDDEEELSEDEIIDNFVTEGGESFILSSDMLSRVPAMTVAPLTSLLLGEEDYDVAEEGGGCEEGSAANRYDKTGKDDSGPAPFVFDWAEAPANSIEPDLPEFREPTGPSNDAKLAKTPLEFVYQFVYLYDFLYAATPCFKYSVLRVIYIGY